MNAIKRLFYLIWMFVAMIIIVILFIPGVVFWGYDSFDKIVNKLTDKPIDKL